MGSVYLAYDEANNRQVALKVLSDQLASSEAYVERFHREARSGAHLDHPHIVRCISEGRDPASGKHFLVMEYIDGPNAHALLDRLGRLPVGDAVHIILDVARALEHAHAHSVVHRDIKPDNILITRTGIAKLADLGLAKRTDEESHLTALRQGFGSLFYIPYEQAFNAKHADERCDIYALGSTLYHLVTGEVPFPGNSHMEIAERKERGLFEPASALNPQVPVALDRILAKMMARDPDERYQLVSEAIVDLERANLAAPLPSFVDHAAALQDPVVLARLNAGKPTQLDLKASVHRAAIEAASPAFWYLRYPNGHGQWRRAKITAEKLTERLRQGRLPRDFEVARQANGDFHPPAHYPELCDELPQVDAGPGAVAPEHAEPQCDLEATPSVPSVRERLRRIPRRVIVAAAMCVGLALGLAALAIWFMQTP